MCREDVIMIIGSQGLSCMVNWWNGAHFPLVPPKWNSSPYQIMIVAGRQVFFFVVELQSCPTCFSWSLKNKRYTYGQSAARYTRIPRINENLQTLIHHTLTWINVQTGANFSANLETKRFSSLLPSSCTQGKVPHQKQACEWHVLSLTIYGHLFGRDRDISSSSYWADPKFWRSTWT